MKKNLLGKNNPNWKGGISKKKSVCKNCHKEFICVSYTPGIYCSRLCQNKYQARQLRNSDWKKKVKKKKKKYLCLMCGCKINRKQKICINCRKKNYRQSFICKQCGKIGECFKNRVKFFCSNKCRLESLNGSGNPNYIDGRTPENKKIRNSKKYKDWRNKILKRDNYTCKLCGKVGGELNVDHIKQFAYYPELRFDEDNGRTLCVKCHKKTDTFMNVIKLPKRRKYVTDAQRDFLDTIKLKGGISGVACSEGEALDIIKL